ncbi:MAG TPA: redoxin domain-containing protein [Bacteroidales bacterium]|nr:redoxin domain-containing protein [Bacteroidales bacterium]
MKKTLLLFSSLFIISLTALFSQGVDYSKLGIETTDSHIPKGLKEGEKAPDFTGYDQAGKQVTLKGLLKNGPVVLFFYRGNWCPTCNKQLESLKDSVNLITDQGFSLVAITPEMIEFVEQTVKLHNINYTVIYDCQEKIMKDYDVMFSVTKDFQDLVQKSLKIDIAEHNGHAPAHLPVTATFIINREGIITATHFNPDFHNRASVNWIIRNMGSAL